MKPDKIYKEWNNEGNSYDREASIIINDFNKKNSGELNRFENKYGNICGILSRNMSKFQKQKKVIERRTKRFGKINQKYVGQELIKAYGGQEPSQRIYDRKRNPRRELEKEGLAVGVLLDQSGSTSKDVDSEFTRLDLIKYSALTLGRSLLNVGDESFIYSFHTHDSADPTIMEQLKREDDKWNRGLEEKISALPDTGGTEFPQNKDGVAIRFANEKLQDSPFKNKCLFVVSDGLPNTDHAYYKGNIAFYDTKKAMEEGNKAGINYVYLTISNGDSGEFIDLITPHTVFAKKYSRMKDIVEGLTLSYEKLKKLYKGK